MNYRHLIIITTNKRKKVNMSKKHEAGICPLCGSDNISYEEIEIDGGDGVFYPATCDDCGATFKECYNLEFDEHIDIEESEE